MLKRILEQEQAAPAYLFQPWLVPALAGGIWLHHVFLLFVVHAPIRWDTVTQPRITAWLLLLMAVLYLAWIALVQAGRVARDTGLGFNLAGFGLCSVAWLDFYAWVVGLGHGDLLSIHFGETATLLITRIGYVAYAMGLGLVAGAALASWRRRA